MKRKGRGFAHVIFNQSEPISSFDIWKRKSSFNSYGLSEIISKGHRHIGLTYGLTAVLFFIVLMPPVLTKVSHVSVCSYLAPHVLMSVFVYKVASPYHRVIMRAPIDSVSSHDQIDGLDVQKR